MTYAAASQSRKALLNEVYVTADPITPTDDADIGPYMALYVGTAGDVALVPVNGTSPVVFKAVPVGILRVAFQGINATDTTADDLVGLG